MLPPAKMSWIEQQPPPIPCVDKQLLDFSNEAVEIWTMFTVIDEQNVTPSAMMQCTSSKATAAGQQDWWLLDMKAKSVQLTRNPQDGEIQITGRACQERHNRDQRARRG